MFSLNDGLAEVGSGGEEQGGEEQGVRGGWSVSWSDEGWVKC